MKLRPLALLLFISILSWSFGQQPQPGAAPVDLGSKALTPPNKWAVVIGVSDYTSDVGKLQFAANDARSFSQYLKSEYDFNGGAVTLLDGATAGSSASSEHINSALDRLLNDKRLDKGNLFVFYFSGHGVGTKNGDYLVPSDVNLADVETKGVSVKSIIDRIVGAGLQNVLIISDACRSGDKNPFGAELQELGAKANIAVLLGCSPGKRSYELKAVGHGAFTYCLLEDMKDKSLLNTDSGALWASALAKKVEADVFAKTEPTYGKYAQRPAVWTEPTQDVLLAAYPSKMAVGERLILTQERLKQLPKEKRAATLEAFVQDLTIASDYSVAIEIGKTAQGLGELSDQTTYFLGLSLTGAGRTIEASKMFDLLDSKDPKAYYAILGRLLSPSRNITARQRVEAAQSILDFDNPYTITIAWNITYTYGSREDTAAFTDKLINGLGEGRARTFLQAFRAAQQEDRTKAAELYEKAISTPHNDTFGDGLIFAHYSVITKDDKFDQLIKRWASAEPHDANPWIRWVIRYRSIEAFEKLKYGISKAVEAECDPDELLTLLRYGGFYVAPYAAKFVARAEKYPYAWKALLAKALGQAITGVESSDILRNSAKYIDDDLSFLHHSSRILDQIILDQLAKGLLGKDQLLSLHTSWTSQFIASADRIGSISDYWDDLVYFSLNNERYRQLNWAIDRNFGDRKPTAAEFFSIYLARLNTGSTASVDRLFQQPAIPEGDRPDVLLIRSADLAMQGRIAESIAAYPASAGCSAPEIRKALGFYLQVRSGKDLKSLPATLKAFTTHDQTAGALVGLCWAQLGRWDLAEPLLAYVGSSHSWGYFFVDAKALNTLFAHKVESGAFEESDMLAYLTTIVGLGSPIFEKVHYKSAESVASFVGQYEFAGVLRGENGERTECSFSIQISKDGGAKLKIEGNDDSWTFQGTVDRFGNLSASNAVAWHVYGKIGPLEFEKRFNDKMLQAFEILMPDGQRKVLLGKVVKS